MNKKLGTYFVAALLIMSSMISMVSATGFEPARVNAGVGGTWPQGSYDKYVDPGVSLTGRVTHDLSPIFSFWGGLSFTVFSSKESLVKPGEYYAGKFPGKLEIDQKGCAFHIGFEFGRRLGIIRPRIAAGPGFYLFFAEIQVTDINSWSDYSPSTRYDDIQGNLGWRGIIGADIAISPTWGISLDFIHDTVWGLHQGGEVLNIKKTSRFAGFAAGVVITFEAFKDKIKDDEWEPRDIPRDNNGN